MKKLWYFHSNQSGMILRQEDLSQNNYSVLPIHLKNKVTCLIVVEQTGKTIEPSKSDDFSPTDTKTKNTKIINIYFTSSLSPLLWFHKIQERTTSKDNHTLAKKNQDKNGKFLIIMDSPILSSIAYWPCFAQPSN